MRVSTEENVEGIVDARVSVVVHVMQMKDEVLGDRDVEDERQHPNDDALGGAAQCPSASARFAATSNPGQRKLGGGHQSGVAWKSPCTVFSQKVGLFTV